MSHDSELEAEMHEIATKWYNYWARVLTLSDMVATWQEASPGRQFSGPFLLMKKIPMIFFRLYDVTLPKSDPQSYMNVFWEFEGVEGLAPYAMLATGEAAPLSLVGEVPPMAQVTGEFTPEEASLLWVSTQARYAALKLLWLEQVSLWMELEVPGAITDGVVVRENGALSMVGYDKDTHALILEMFFSAKAKAPELNFYDE